MSTKHLLQLVLLFFWFVARNSIPAPLGTATSYQGYLTESGLPAKGLYDLSFALFEAADGENQVGAPVAISPIAVSNGLFLTSLDFGIGAFDGNARWLQISVRTNGSLGPYIKLSPRQLV